MSDRGDPTWAEGPYRSGGPPLTDTNCTTCLAKSKLVEARFVAGDADGLEWYECGQHKPDDNLAGVTRQSLTPIAEWRKRHGLPPEQSR